MYSPAASIDYYAHGAVTNSNDVHPLMEWVNMKPEPQPSCYPPSMFHAPLPPPALPSNNHHCYDDSNAQHNTYPMFDQHRLSVYSAPSVLSSDEYYGDDTLSLKSNSKPPCLNASPSSSLSSSPFSPDCCMQHPSMPTVDYHYRPNMRRSFDFDSMEYGASCTCLSATATSNQTSYQDNTFYQQQHPVSPITPVAVTPPATMMEAPEGPRSPKNSMTTTTATTASGTNGDIRPYACCMCTRAFARKHDLQRHVRVHTGDKPYICLCCKKAFARTDALKRHLRMEESCRLSPEVQAMKCAGKRRYRNL
ncbi:hypothetical protein BJV82DRAFT_633596 [Fennellomyces sp. T-0311]|nr:hypothetical protein BJV82DRAFT_633596 [Fennellomyces sp. T-0311]